MWEGERQMRGVTCRGEGDRSQQSPMLPAPPLLAKNPPALSTRAHRTPCL